MRRASSSPTRCRPTPASLLARSTPKAAGWAGSCAIAAGICHLRPGPRFPPARPRPARRSPCTPPRPRPPPAVRAREPERSTTPAMSPPPTAAPASRRPRPVWRRRTSRSPRRRTTPRSTRATSRSSSPSPSTTTAAATQRASLSRTRCRRTPASHGRSTRRAPLGRQLRNRGRHSHLRPGHGSRRTTQAASTFTVHITSPTTAATGGTCPGAGTVDNTGNVTTATAAPISRRPRRVAGRAEHPDREDGGQQPRST